MSTLLTNDEKGQLFELFELTNGVVSGIVYDWIDEAVIITNQDSGEIVKIFTSNSSTEVMFSLLDKPRNLVIQGNRGEQ